MELEQISQTLESLPLHEALETLLSAADRQKACLTCSFQAEDMIVLHLLRQEIPEIPVLFLDTGYHFAQTYEYRDRITNEWQLHLVNVLPQLSVAQQESQFGILYQSDPTQCCQLRKVEPLMRSLEPYEIWFTGLRREQSPSRKNLKILEQHRLPGGKTLLKVSLLADWTWKQVWNYVGAHQLSYLPQYDQGYLSIGCQPCTAIPDDPNNPRSGRWGGKKLECGIHTFSQKAEQ
jgi:phosphoadenosine phosphosulfate reductase